MAIHIYMDVCCLNRPFNDQTSFGIATESAAVVRLLREADSGELLDFSSEMAEIEIAQDSDLDRRRRVTSLLPPDARIIPLDRRMLALAGRLTEIGFGVADAVHLSAAQRLSVDVFLTVDDRLPKRARRLSEMFEVRVLNPVALVEELDQ